MADNRKGRREYLAVEAFNLDDGTTCVVYISFDRMQTVGRRSMGHAKECGYIVPEVLQKPACVFEGLCRDEDDDRRGVGWRCYCAVPSRRFSADGSECRPLPNRVYLVFVNDEGVAYNWRAEDADRENRSFPNGHADRFKKRIYPV